MKRFKIAFVVLFVALAGVIGWQVMKPSDEPVYKGKPLATFLRDASQVEVSNNSVSFGMPQHGEAAEAVRQAGTNAIPTLLRLLRAKDSAWKNRLIGLQAYVRTGKEQYIPAALLNGLAVEGFRGLGPKAQGAVPALIQIVNENISPDSRIAAIQSLAFIGPKAKQAVPYLLEYITNGNPRSVGEAIFALRYIDPEVADKVESTFSKKVLYCSGTVRYPNGAPAPGVRVEYYPGHHDGAGHYTDVKSDADGRFEIIGPEDTAMHNGFIDKENCVMARAVEGNLVTVQEFQMTTTHVDLVLQPGITLSGSVKDTEGAPIAGAEVYLGFVVGSSSGGFRVPLLEAQPTKVNESGQFSVPALPQGREYQIARISAKGYGSGYAWVEAKNTQTNRYEFPTFVLKRADRKIAGRVLDEAGKPLAGAEVYFMGKGQPMNLMGLGKSFNSTNTDSEGRFHFDAVCDAPLFVHASYRDPLDQRIHMELNGDGMPAQPSDTNIDIRLDTPDKAH